jgi:hypothetical protein
MSLDLLETEGDATGWGHGGEDVREAEDAEGQAQAGAVD